jgi:hypothetical protein
MAQVITWLSAYLNSNNGEEVNRGYGGRRRRIQEHELPVGHAAAECLVTAPVLLADDGRENSAFPSTVHITLANDDLRNLRACEVSF